MDKEETVKDLHTERADREGISRPEAKIRNYREAYGVNGSMKNEWARYHRHLGKIADDDLNYIKRKDTQYGGSWKKRGGVGAFFTMLRPWDRLETMLAQPKVTPNQEPINGDQCVRAGTHYLPVAYQPYDIFAAIQSEGLKGEDGTFIACVRDLRRYLLLLEAEMTERLVPEKMVPREVQSAPVSETHTVSVPVTTDKAAFAFGAVDIDMSYHYPWRISADCHRGELGCGRADVWTQLLPNLFRLEPAINEDEYERIRPAAQQQYLKAGAFWVLDLSLCPADIRTTYPVMQNEMNEKEHSDMPEEYRGMYDWNGTANKWTMNERYRAWLPGGAR